MFVVGATHPEELHNIRKLAPDSFLLIPGVGAQGGDVDEICKNGLNKDCGIIINSARNIIYASSGEDFALAARKAALAIKEEMAKYLQPLQTS
jgi:orotidine-5'-phosphate decarboxylase